MVLDSQGPNEPYPPRDFSLSVSGFSDTASRTRLSNLSCPFAIIQVAAGSSENKYGNLVSGNGGIEIRSLSLGRSDQPGRHLYQSFPLRNIDDNGCERIAFALHTQSNKS